MKNIIFISASLLLMSSCGGGAGVSDKQADSIRIADSIEAVKADSMKNAKTQDSLNLIKAQECYDNAITITPGKPALSWMPEGEAQRGTWDIEVKNNTPFPIKGDDVQLTYSKKVEVTKNGDLVEITKVGTVVCPDLAPDTTLTVTVKEKGILGLSNARVKLKPSKEEFVKKVTGK